MQSSPGRQDYCKWRDLVSKLLLMKDLQIAKAAVARFPGALARGDPVDSM